VHCEDTVLLLAVMQHTVPAAQFAALVHFRATVSPPPPAGHAPTTQS
jgi:hypothetical protein